MPPIGDTLREARMRQQLDIVDVEQRTKIRAKYLRALENEEWALLPGPTFVRTFLRTYAEAVGLDPHVLVEAYRAQGDSDEEPDAQQPLAATPRRRPQRTTRSPERRRAAGPSRPPGPAAVLGAVVVLVIAGLLVLGLLGDDDPNPDGDRAQQTATTQTQTTPKRPARPRPAPKPAPRGVAVKVEPTAPTYLCMDSGDGSDKVFEGILEEPRTFRNATELRINLGKRAVKVTANGKPVTIAPSGDPLGLRITRTGASEITDGPRPCA